MPTESRTRLYEKLFSDTGDGREFVNLRSVDEGLYWEQSQLEYTRLELFRLQKFQISEESRGLVGAFLRGRPLVPEKASQRVPPRHKLRCEKLSLLDEVF